MEGTNKQDLRALAQRLLKDGPVKTHPASPRRVRILYNKHYIADTTDALYVWEHTAYPYFYLRRDAFGMEGDNASEWKWDEILPIKDDKGETAAKIWQLTVGEKKMDRIIAFEKGKLGGWFRVEFGAVDQWYEEDTPIFVHPKDPFKRIDIIASTRSVRVSVAGTVVAETSTSMHLYETSLPCRYYMPLTSINQAFLRPSSTRTQCPYKGEAEYYDIVLPPENGERSERVFKDYVWYYNRPTVECSLVTGMACFYNEKVDIEVDGVKFERPKTLFS